MRTEAYRKYHREWMAKWRKANPEKAKSVQRDWRHKNHEHALNKQREYVAERREHIRIQKRKWQLKNWQKTLSQRKEQYRANPESFCEQNKSLRKLFPERYKEYDRRKYLRHIDYSREYKRRYIKTPKGKAVKTESGHRRRARKLAVSLEDCSTKITQLHAQRFCHWCCSDLSKTLRTIDHVTPLFRGGLHVPYNLVAACKSCNSKKGTKLVSEWTWELAA